MKIGIIGSGHIGGNFGLLVAQAGHQVFFSSRHPEKLETLVKETGREAQAGSIEAAARFGEVIVISIPYQGLPEVANQVKELVAGKIIIDTCNPYPGRDGKMAEEVRNDPNRRETQLTLDLFPDSKVVKALNTIYFENLRNYSYKPAGQRIGLPVAGNDPEAKETVKKLLDEIGFSAVDIGTIDESGLMEVDRELYNILMSPAEIVDHLQKPKPGMPGGGI